MVIAFGPAFGGMIRWRPVFPPGKRGAFARRIMPKHIRKHIDIRWELSQILLYRRAKQGAAGEYFGCGGQFPFAAGPSEIVNHLI
jgi:hypothetical protein